jgi:hypothetical protein
VGTTHSCAPHQAVVGGLALVDAARAVVQRAAARPLLQVCGCMACIIKGGNHQDVAGGQTHMQHIGTAWAERTTVIQHAGSQ